jgi:transcriptional regulator with XRE-family HTH domain
MHRGDKIKSLIKQSGVSQKSVAETMGLKATNLSTLLKDKDLKDGIVERICEVVGVDYESNFGAGAEEAVNTQSGSTISLEKYLLEKTEWLNKQQDYMDKLEEKNEAILELTAENYQLKEQLSSGGMSKVG